MVVMPWNRKFSARGRSWMVVEMWAWWSMNPGATMSPLASSSVRPLRAGKPSRAIAVIIPLAMPRSAAFRRVPELIVVQQGRLERHILDDEQDSGSNVDLGRLPEEAQEPLTDWVDVTRWIEEDEVKLERPEQGWLWIHQAV